MTPRDKAWSATQVAFAIRLCGRSPLLKPDTDFPAESVAAETEGPRDSSYQSHKAAFARLERNFGERWEQWAA